MTDPTSMPRHDAERERLQQDARRERNWKRWGPYLAERQWGTVREDYSGDGSCWDYFPHEHARSRAYRWGEDGLLGITDRQGRMCFALALWNGKDAYLKERLFGLTGPQGNHGEDVKEEYFYLDSTPTHSWMRGLYKYPQVAYPYERLLAENRARGNGAQEFELRDSGVFADDRYFDVFVDYGKADTDDVLVRITVHNRGANAAELHVLPTLWFRNTWSWGRSGEGYWPRPAITLCGERTLSMAQDSLGDFALELDVPPPGVLQGVLFTENDTNAQKLFGAANPQPYVKDAFHRCVVNGERAAVNPAQTGSKAAFHCRFVVPGKDSVELRLRLRRKPTPDQQGGELPAAFGREFNGTMTLRQSEADAFYQALQPKGLVADELRAQRQAYAGLLWSKQFFYFDVSTWLEGDPAQPPPPPQRAQGRNKEWRHLYNRDVVSMPDKWEYPWYAAWDLAFHMIPFAHLDPDFSKEQLLLFLREWYMAPSGQIPAYEFNFSDVNPPVHAWAVWRVYKLTGERGKRDRTFLERAFLKLLLNFTWWVNRKDLDGKHVFGGGFLGLDNIGVFDRSRPLPNGGSLEQADGTAWMAFYCSTMLSIALELAKQDVAYEDVASKFFEHFVAITHAMNTLGGTGLWDERDGFYYDQMHAGGRTERLRIRSMVGIIPLFAVEVLEESVIGKLKGFSRRMHWFLENEKDLAQHVVHGEHDASGHGHVLLAIPSKERLVRVLRCLLDETEFLSPYGVRSLSAAHKAQPFVLDVDGSQHRVEYSPGESTTSLFGGNSNWRGPVWMPVNYLLLEALQRWHHFYGDDLKVECPVGSGTQLTLAEVAAELGQRLVRMFVPGPDGVPPFAGGDRRFADDPHWRDLVLFHEYFHGDTGRGCGASHQTGWTALVARCFDGLGQLRTARAAAAAR
jgi:hypothetical protein